MKKVHGRMPTVVFLDNLNDSLALSHVFGYSVAVDSIYSSMLKLKTKSQIGLKFSVLEQMAQIGIPDFGDLSLEKLLELRKDRALKSFRSFVSTLSSRLKSEPNLNFEALITQELLSQISELAPNKRKISLNMFIGALSNIPCPIVGAIATTGQTGKDLKEYSNFSSNWLSFILKARE